MVLNKWAGWALAALLWTAGARAEMGVARVAEVLRGSGVPEVVLEAGRLDGLAERAQVTLLRQGEAIVHPLTGEVLGVPQEPVGLVEIHQLEERRSRGVLVKTYSTPRVGDMAEYERQSMPVAAPAMNLPKESSPQAVDEVMEKVKSLEKDLEKYQKSQKSLSAYPVFAQQVWDELGSLKAYLVALDERLIELEAQQGEDRHRLAAALGGEYQARDLKELTIRYSEDTDLRLKVAGKTLVIAVERDTVRLEEVAEGEELEPLAEETAGGMDWGDLSALLGTDMESMLKSPYVHAGSLLLIAVLAGTLWYLMKRREQDMMDDLDELQEEYLEEDLEEEEYSRR